jgi:hypothetical protein
MKQDKQRNRQRLVASGMRQPAGALRLLTAAIQGDESHSYQWADAAPLACVCR